MGDIKTAGIEFRVTTKELMRSMQMMSDATEKAQKELEGFCNAIRQLDACFQGKSKEMFVKKANVIVTQWQELLRELYNNISDLQEIVISYEKAEGENVNVIMENDC